MAPRVRKGHEALAAALENAKAPARHGAHDALTEIADGVGYLAHIGEMDHPEDQARIEDVAETHNEAAVFDRHIVAGPSG